MRRKHAKARRIKPGPGHFTPAEVAAIKRAAEPGLRTPKVVLDAFLPQPLKLDGLPLQPMTLGIFMILQKCGCRLVGDEETRKAANNYDAALAGYVLTSPIEAGLALANLPPAERELAVYAFAHRIPMGSMEAFGIQLGAHMRATFATVISPASSGEDTGAGVEKKTTPAPAVPPPCPPKTTASAGS